jgi:hypothetical protein
MKKDIRRFRRFCRANGLSEEERHEFSDYLHQRKQSGYGGSAQRGDFTMSELRDLLTEFRAEED